MSLALFYLQAVKTFSILLQASKGFQNYRHMTNLRILNDLVQKQPVLNLFSEDIFQDERNVERSKVYLNEKTSRPYKKLKCYGHTVNDFLNLLYCKPKRMKGVKGSNVFVYMTGHGNDGVFKFHDREWLCCDDLMEAIHVLSSKSSKVLLIIDTCQAETMIVREDLPMNVFAVTSSVKDESSISTIHNTCIGVSTVDNFIYYMNEAFYTLSSNVRLVDFFYTISRMPVGSTLSYSSYENFYVSDFFNCKKFN